MCRSCSAVLVISTDELSYQLSSSNGYPAGTRRNDADQLEPALQYGTSVLALRRRTIESRR